jgi:hypothetical protein
MFAPALAAVPGQPSTGTQCAIDDFLGALQVKYDDYRAAGRSLFCLSGLGSGETPNPELLGGDK